MGKTLWFHGSEVSLQLPYHLCNSHETDTQNRKQNNPAIESWEYYIIYLGYYCQFLTFSAMVNNLNISINYQKLFGIKGKKQTLESDKQIKFWILHCVALAESITVHEFLFSYLKNGDNGICLIGKGLWELNEGCEKSW